ncbi:MAG: PilZ domain-containing protein [Minicystis sp.]
MAARDHFRAHARRRVDLDATLRGRDGAFSHVARVRDLGLGGACVEIGDPTGSAALLSGEPRPAVGVEREASITLEVMAPTLWDPLLLGGRIAWVRRGTAGRPTRAGVRFEHRDPASLFALFQLLGAHVYDA